jgi:hypothetical protein
MDSMSATLLKISLVHRTRVKVKATRFSDIRPSLGMKSYSHLLETTTILKQLCREILADVIKQSNCRSACQSSYSGEVLCTAHEKWVHTIFQLDQPGNDETYEDRWEEIDQCPECNNKQHYVTADECVVNSKNVSRDVLADKLSTTVQVDKDLIIFLIWHCYTNVCSKKMLITAGVIEWLLLGLQYEHILRAEIQSFQLYFYRYLAGTIQNTSACTNSCAQSD